MGRRARGGRRSTGAVPRAFLPLALAVALALAAAWAPVASGAAPAERTPVDATIDAYFSLLSGPAGERDWQAFRALFLPSARFHAMGIDEKGEPGYFPSVLDGYVHHVAEFVESRGFYQSDDCRRSVIYGRTATVVAAFESRLQPDGDPIDRGVISFHLVAEGGAWRIASVLWNSATAGEPAPREGLECAVRGDSHEGSSAGESR